MGETPIAHRHHEDPGRRLLRVQPPSDEGELRGQIRPAPVGLEGEAGLAGRRLRVLSRDLLELVVGVDETQGQSVQG
jgi:hypothetical protein